jgi:transcriptional regulator with XRE-family HTH domain
MLGRKRKGVVCMTLGQRIQDLRRAAGLSQEGLGEKLGVSRQAVSKWEADGAVPELDKLIALGRLFGVSLNELLQLDAAGDGTEEAVDETAVRLTRRRWINHAGHALTAALVLVFAAVLAVLWLRVDALERSTGASPPPRLDSSAPLVSSFDFDFVDGTIFTGTQFTLRLSLLPAQSMEGMTVTFQVTQRGQETVLIPAQRAEGGTEYSASQYFRDGSPDGMTISAIFDDGTRQYTQALVRINNWTPNSWTWESLWKSQD